MPLDSDQLDFGALLKAAPAAQQAPQGQNAPDFKALLQKAPTPQEEQQIEVPDARFPGVSGPTSLGNGAGAVGAGVAKGILGMLGFLADSTGSKELGTTIANKTAQLNKEIESGGTGAKIGAAGGEMLPFLLGGEAAGALKVASKVPAAVRYLGSGMAAGLTAPQDAKTPEERGQARVTQAAEGAMLSGAVRAGSSAGTSLALKLMASKRLDSIIKDITGTFENFVPTGTEVAAAVKPSIDSLVSKYQTSIRGLQKEVARSGGVDTKPIVDASKPVGPEVGDPKSPSGKMLAWVRGQIDPYAPNTEGIDEKLSKEFASVPDTVKRQIEQQTGKKLLPTPGASGDLLHLKDVVKKIDTHIEGLPSGAIKDPDVKRLVEIRNTIDQQTKEFLSTNKKAQTMYRSMNPGYETMVKQAEQPEIRGILSPNPTERVDAILSAVKNPDSRQIKNLARFLGPTGSAEHQDAFHVVMHDAFLSAVDKKTGAVDAGKFANYFRDPTVKQNLQFLKTPQQEAMIKGMQNLINFNAIGRAAEGQHDIFNLGRHVFPGFLMARGIERSANALLSGHGLAAAAIPLASSFAGAGFMVGASRYAENLLARKIGRNFLIAASKVKPDSPEMFKIVDSFSRRLSAAGAVAGSQQTGVPSGN